MLNVLNFKLKMENLMNRWRHTVDNHNKKLQNIRDSSLGASSNGGTSSLAIRSRMRS